MYLFKAVTLLIFYSLSSSAAVVVPEHEFIASTGKKIEFFWAKPEGKGPFPTLLLIHPDQDSPKLGGEMFVKSGQLDYWTQKGFLTIAISQPGYGQSQGPADFCGPQTQQAAIDLVKHFQSMPIVDSNLFFVYGGSRGAVAASMLATTEIKLRGLVLKSGVYDFIEWANSRHWYDEIKFDMFLEIGWLNQEKLKARSAYYLVDKIKVPLLIIHGTKDDRAPIGLTEKFVDKVNGSGGKAQFIKIDSEHVIPMTEIRERMEQFMRGLF